MRRYALRRVLLFVPMLLALATFLFLLVELAPGGPGEVFLGPGMSRAVQDQLRTNLGLDAPLPVRYLRWLAALATGELGYSWSWGQPVARVLASVLPNTLLLTGVSLVMAFVLGTAVGIVQAVKRNTVVDGLLNLGVLLFYSVPSFWLGILLILVFAWAGPQLWGWPVGLPASGAVSVGHDLMGPGARVLDRLSHLVLPATTLALVLGAGVARHARSSMLEVIRQDYVVAARARGLSRMRVLWLHAFPNSLLPLITLFGLYVPVLFSGAVFVEVVFAWPGMGRLMVDAVASRDYPLILAGGMGFGLLVLVANLAADLLYGLADPRVRHD